MMEVKGTVHKSSEQGGHFVLKKNREVVSAWKMEDLS